MTHNARNLFRSFPLSIMLKFSAYLAVVAGVLPIVSGSPAAASAAASAPASTSTALLHQLATSLGKLYFGSATDNPELTNTSYVAILDNSQMFGQTTATNSMKWV